MNGSNEQEPVNPQPGEGYENRTAEMENPSPFQAETPTPPRKETKPVGPVIGIIVIVILLILGGFYFWGAQLNKGVQDKMTAEEIMQKQDPALSELETYSASDEVADIETDLNATNLENLDQELRDIDLELSL